MVRLRLLLCAMVFVGSLVSGIPVARADEPDPRLPEEPLPAPDEQAARTFVVTPQLNDSNCDYIAVQNGVQNIGGDGERAYWLARELVPQQPRDFKESFYTLLGPSGSDQPFSLNNLGAAPEAFVGVYEALGYNTVMLGAPPGAADEGLAQAIYHRLAATPDRSFAHVWITYGGYNPQARQLTVEETGETVDLIYPYHEIVAMVDPAQPGQLVVLDGLIGYPYAVSPARLAWLMRAFNRGIVVSGHAGDYLEHQRLQATQRNQPYVIQMLGGSYLAAARRLWGASYPTWGAVVGHPYRSADGGTVIVPGEYVAYQRVGAGPVTLAPLGRSLRNELVGQGLVPDQPVPPELVNGMRAWAEGTFGSVVRFHEIFGAPVTAEFVLTPEQLRASILRGTPFAPIDQSSGSIFVLMLTERAALAWEPSAGTVVLPLGRIAYDRINNQ